MVLLLFHVVFSRPDMCAAVAYCVVTCMADANTSCAWVPPVYRLVKCLFMSFAHFLVTFFPEDFFWIICMPVCLCRKMGTWVQVPVGARRGRQIPPELESQVTVSCPMWVLGTNRPFARAKSNSCWVIPLAWNVLMLLWLLNLGFFLLTLLSQVLGLQACITKPGLFLSRPLQSKHFKSN